MESPLIALENPLGAFGRRLCRSGIGTFWQLSKNQKAVVGPFWCRLLSAPLF
jgi:hypothetical protein